MCVAIYKQEGAKALDMETCRKCWDANDDGAGFAWRREDGLIEWMKGFMAFEDFWKAYNALPGKDAKEMILHFRIGTHGGNVPQNTHPFPISADVDDLKALHGVCDEILMHNGVLPITPRSKGISDTMELALRMAEAGCGARKVLKTLDGFTGDRVLIMDAEGIASLGGWHEEREGVWFSNLIWKNYGLGWGFDSCAFGKSKKETRKKEKASKKRCASMMRCSDDERLYDYDDGGLFDDYVDMRANKLDDAFEQWMQNGFEGGYVTFIDSVHEFEDEYGEFDADMFIDWMLDRDGGELKDRTECAAGN